jgi:hypothetical protein
MAGISREKLPAKLLRACVDVGKDLLLLLGGGADAKILY